MIVLEAVTNRIKNQIILLQSLFLQSEHEYISIFYVNFKQNLRELSSFAQFYFSFFESPWYICLFSFSQKRLKFYISETQSLKRISIIE